MRHFTRRSFLAASGAMGALALGSLSQRSRLSAQTSVVNLYSSRHYDSDNALYGDFERLTNLKIRLVEAEADELITRIKSEGANSPADMLMTVDAGRLWRAEEEGLFQAVNSPALNSAVPENLRHPEGYWFGLTKRVRVIFYNKAAVDPGALSTYEDLASPKWRGKVLIRSSTNIYNQSLVGSLIAAHGEADTKKWVEGLVANFARSPEGNDTAQIRACAEGVGDVAIANHYYYVRLATSSDPADRAVAEKVGLFFPNQGNGERGAHVNISGAGILKTAPNSENALRMLEYLIAPDAQEAFAVGNYEYPVRRGVAVIPALTEYGEFKEDPVNADVFGRNNLKALQLCDEAGWR